MLDLLVHSKFLCFFVDIQYTITFIDVNSYKIYSWELIEQELYKNLVRYTELHTIFNKYRFTNFFLIF